MLSEHEHGLPALSVQLLEQDKRLFVQTQTPLLVAVDDVKRVLAPVGRDVVFFECHGEDFVAGVVY